MANTPPPLPLSQRATSDLLDELCVGLRNAGVQAWSLHEVIANRIETTARQPARWFEMIRFRVFCVFRG